MFFEMLLKSCASLKCRSLGSKIRLLKRRHFVSSGLWLAGSALLPASVLANAGLAANASPNAASPLLSFSTLGCPKWDLPQVLSFAAAKGYQGVELRGINGELNLPASPWFRDSASTAATLQRFRDNKLRIAGLGSSAELHHADPAKRREAIDQAKAFIDLANALGGTNVRVFPNKLPKEENKKVVIDRIAAGMNELAAYAKGGPSTVLLETHGDLVWADDIVQVMQQVSGPAGVIWDIYNMWTITQEAPAVVFPKLRPYIRHTHIKDSQPANGQEHYVLLGKGRAPVREAVALLKSSGYSGFYSFEWEKLWHPDIAEPEIALADFPQAFKKIW